MTALLTTVIGLIGVYIAFALAASWVNEQIATLLKLRSKTLIAGIRRMVGDAATANFFGHPLIDSLGEAPVNIWTALGMIFGLRYVGQRVPKVPAQTTPAKTKSGIKNIPYVNSNHFASIIADILLGEANGRSPLPSFGASATDVVAALNSIGVEGHPYKPLYDALLPIWNGAKGDYDRFLTDLASWYDGHMERVSGWYKRSVSIILAYIGLLIAFGFNVDTIQIITQLQRNTNLANTLAAVTEAYYREKQPEIKAGSVDITSVTSFVTDCSSQNPCVCNTGFVVSGKSPNQVCRVDQSVLSQLPLGWTLPRWRAFKAGLVPNPTATFHEKLMRSGLWSKLLGLAITTLAILLGAPFWFDLLGAIVNVRSGGEKPPPSSAK